MNIHREQAAGPEPYKFTVRAEVPLNMDGERWEIFKRADDLLTEHWDEICGIPEGYQDETLGMTVIWDRDWVPEFTCVPYIYEIEDSDFDSSYYINLTVQFLPE